MSVRSLSKQEDDAAKSLRKLGMITRWEWMAVFDIDRMKKITFRTDRRTDGTDSDQAMRDHQANGGSIIVHHNHPSDESLSSADWAAFINFYVDEIFAHTIDGSIFYGKVLNRPGVAAALANYDDAGDAGEYVVITTAEVDEEARGPLAGFLRKHVVALALYMKGYIDYQFTLGPVWQAVVSDHGTLIPAATSAAMAKL